MATYDRFVECAADLPSVVDVSRAALQALCREADKLYTRKRRNAGDAYVIEFDEPVSPAQRAWVETALALFKLGDHHWGLGLLEDEAEKLELRDLMHSLEFMLESGPEGCLAVKRRMLGSQHPPDSVEIVFARDVFVCLGKVVMVDAEEPSVVGSVMYVPHSGLDWRDVIGSPLL